MKYIYWKMKWHMWCWANLTSLKLQLRLLPEVALSESVAIHGGAVLQHSGPVDRGEHRDKYPQQGPYDANTVWVKTAKKTALKPVTKLKLRVLK